MRNDLPILAEVRHPRGIIKINGEAMPGCVSWRCDNNTFYQADTFRIVFAFALSLMPPEFDALWWSSQKEISAEIFAGFPANPDRFDTSELDSLIYGNVDDIDFDPVKREIELCGRDLTSHFIDTKTTEEWKNQRSSDIATALAKRHGLTPVVTTTSTKVGSYYEIDQVRVTNQHSEWDLLTYLAQKEEFVVYVKGKELHFEPKPAESQDPYVLQWQEPNSVRAYPEFNGTHIRFTRNLTVAKGVVVWVQAVNVKTGKSFEVAYPATHAKGTKPGQSSPKMQVYTYRLRNRAMTPEAALQYAQARHKEITQHEVRMHAVLPADNILGVTDIIQVTGTNSAFDQIYYPESIVREMSVDEGYLMTVSAKNISHQNEVTL